MAFACFRIAVLCVCQLLLSWRRFNACCHAAADCIPQSAAAKFGQTYGRFFFGCRSHNSQQVLHHGASRAGAHVSAALREHVLLCVHCVQ
jgi:hypothetical protein